MGKELISVLIPTYNAENYIQPLLEKLLNQKLKSNQRIEIIIIDSSSTDSTIKSIDKYYPEVKYQIIPNDDFDHGGTRNYLASLANGDYYLFMTQDAIPYDNELIFNLVNNINSNEDIMVSFARQIAREDASPLETFARSYNYPEDALIKSEKSLEALGIKTFFNSNVCSMYKKAAFEKYGGFPEKIILNEDMIFASKVILGGEKVSYSPTARVYHSHNYRIKDQFKRYFDIGMAFESTNYLLKYGSSEKEGIKMLKKQINYLYKTKNLKITPYMLLENLIKLFSYRLGKMHYLIPVRIKRNLSAYSK